MDVGIGLYFSGLRPKVSVALATQRATAMGSVHPMAGTTSRLMRAMICSLSDWLIMVFDVVSPQSYTEFFLKWTL